MKKFIFIIFQFIVHLMISSLVFAIQYTRTDDVIIFGTGKINDAMYSLDGSMIATANSLGLFIWDSEDFNLLQYQLIPKGLRYLKWSPDGKKIFITNQSNYIIYDVSNNLIVTRIYIDINWYINTYYPSYGDEDVITNITLYPIRTPLIHKNSVDFSKNSERFVVVAAPNQLQVYDTNTGELLSTMSCNNEQIFSVGYAMDGSKIWSGTYESGIYFFDGITFDLYNSNHISGKSDIYLISPDDRFLFTANNQLVYPNGYLSFRTYVYDLQNEISFNVADGYVGEYTRNFIQPPHIVHFANDGNVYVLENRYHGNDSVIIERNYYQLFLENGMRNFISALPYYTCFALPFSPDGRTMLTNGAWHPTPDLLKYDIFTGETTRLLPNEWYKIVSFLPTDNNELFMHTEVYRDDASTVTEIWNPNTKEEITEIIEKPFYDIGAFSPSGDVWASPSQSASSATVPITLWNTHTWEPIHEFNPDQAGATNDLRFSSDGSQILAARNKVWIWNTATGELLHTLDGHDNRVYHSNFSSNGKYVITAGEDGRLLLWNLDIEENTIIAEREHPILFTSYIHDESDILFVTQNGTVEIIHTENNQVTKTIATEIELTSIHSVALTHDDEYILIAGTVWDIDTGVKINAFGENLNFKDLIISPNGEWIAGLIDDNTVRVWEASRVLQATSSVERFDNYKN